MKLLEIFEIFIVGIACLGEIFGIRFMQNISKFQIACLENHELSPADSLDKFT